MYWTDFLEITRNIGWVIIFGVHVILFPKENKTYKFFVLYLFANMVYKCATTFMVDKSFIEVVFLIVQQIILGFLYYNLIENKKQRIVLILLFVCSLLFMSTSLFKESITLNNLGLNLLVVTIVVSVVGFMHHFNQLRGEKNFFYFNIGILFFFLSVVFLFIVFLTIFSITRQVEIFDNFVNVMHCLEIVFLGFIFKENRGSFKKFYNN